MTRALLRCSWLVCISLALLGRVAAAPTSRPVLLTGEVVASDSQTIFVPPSNNSPVLLRNFVAEGSTVKKGDLVLRIESKEADSLSRLEIELEQAKARSIRETADLIVKAIESEQALLTAEAALSKAQVDAAIPKEHLSALDYDRYQGERARTELDLQLKTKATVNANEAVSRRRTDGELEAKKLLFNLLFLKSQLAESEVRAARDGLIVHGYSEWRGERCDEGTSAAPGNTAGHILGSGQMRVRAWALEADRPFLSVGQSVQLGFDALPGVSVIAAIERIAGAPQSRTAWGTGRYFQIDIKLPAKHDAPLIPGMSVIIEPVQEQRALVAKNITLPGELMLEGEIASLRSVAIGPPEISEVWQYQLAQLAPEGSIVKAGDPVAVFGAQDLGPSLDTKQSALKEKQRAVEKMKLDHAEAAKAAEIAVSQAQSDAEKAARKASQPKDQIRRVDYDKILIDRELTAKLAALAIRQRDAQAAARAAERVALNLEIEQLDTSIALITKGLANLTVTAKQAGMVLYRSQFNGEKFAIGTQVWMGLSVATLADPEQLVVNATVPEAQAIGVRVGQHARVNVPGANISLQARVKSLGRMYHIKSRTQPVIVRDVQLEFDTPPKGVKPGAAVQVAVFTSEPAKVASNEKPGVAP